MNPQISSGSDLPTNSVAAFASNNSQRASNRAIGHNAKFDAYYDPHAKCIRYQNNPVNGAGELVAGERNHAYLEGTVVQMPPGGISYFQPGKILRGEILEIVSMDDSSHDDDSDAGDFDSKPGTSQPLVSSRPDQLVEMRDGNEDEGRGIFTSKDDATTDNLSEEEHGEGEGDPNHQNHPDQQNINSAEYPNNDLDKENPLSAHSFDNLSKEQLLQKQRQQQELHCKQSQDLFHKHQKDRQLLSQLDSAMMEQQNQLLAMGGADAIAASKQKQEQREKMKTQWVNEMENRHEKELLDLQKKQQKEQEELMTLILDSLTRGAGSAMDNAIVVNAEENGIGNEQQRIHRYPHTEDIQYEQYPGQQSQHPTPPRQQELHQLPQQHQQQPQQHDHLHEQNQKHHLQQQPQHQNLHQISQPQDQQPGENQKLQLVQPQQQIHQQQTEVTQSQSKHKQKQEEIKAVMRDRTLGREERQKRLAEIKSRYSIPELDEGSNYVTLSSSSKDVFNESSNGFNVSSTSAFNSSFQSLNASSNALGEDVGAIGGEKSHSKVADEQRRKELQAVMKNRSLSREEKQKRLAEIKAKYSGSNQDGAPQSAEQQEKKDGSFTEGGTKNTNASNAQSYSAASEMKMLQQQRLNRRNSLNNIQGQKKDIEKNDGVDEKGSDSDDDYRSEFNTAATRWNGAEANGNAGNNTLQHTQQKSSKPSAADRRNKAAIGVASSNITARNLNGTSTKNDVDGSEDLNESSMDLNESSMDLNESSMNLDDAIDSSSDDGSSSNQEVEVSSKEESSREVHEDETPDRPLSKEEKLKKMQEIKEKLLGDIGDGIVDIGTESSDALTTEARPVSAISSDPNGVSASITSAITFATSVSASHTSGSTTQTSTINMDEIPTSKAHINKIIRQIKSDDSTLSALKLDGRKSSISSSNWESLFEALEENTNLIHLSLQKCGLDDEDAVSLVLALVENETLLHLYLGNNKGLTEDTGKGLVKVLNQSNKSLKTVDLKGTKVSKKTMSKIQKILDERDEQKQLAKVRASRESKMRELLAVSASDKVASELAEKEGNIEDDNDDLQSRKSQSMISITSSKKSKQSKQSKQSSKLKRGASKGMERAKSRVDRSSVRSSTLSSASGSVGKSNRASMRQSSSNLRASVTARHMATLGGDIGVGEDSKKLRETRKLRGECEDCGQKCFEKKMFKTTPLTIPNVVFQGRCLKCNPM